jgi:hypothetical protein
MASGVVRVSGCEERTGRLLREQSVSGGWEEVVMEQAVVKTETGCWTLGRAPSERLGSKWHTGGYRGGADTYGVVQSADERDSASSCEKRLRVLEMRRRCVIDESEERGCSRGYEVQGARSSTLSR